MSNRQKAIDEGATSELKVVEGEEEKFPTVSESFNNMLEQFEEQYDKQLVDSVKNIREHKFNDPFKASPGELVEQLRKDYEISKANQELMVELEATVKEQLGKLEKRMEKAVTMHDKHELVNEVLETMLDHVNSKIPKEEFEVIDNTPKNLLHLTDEDLKPKSPEQLRHELNELIKEAKSKIKPVLVN